MNYNIMAYGAVADGQTNCREAIQKAIDHCNENGVLLSRLENI